MKKLETREWIAVCISVFVIGFFFLFGQDLISLLNGSASTNMSQDSGLQVNDSVVGTGMEAQAGKKLTVHYTGMFSDGKVFDSSVQSGTPFQFALGAGQVIKGWDEGLVGMKVGGRRIIIVPSEYGYGPNDYGPIPGGSTLIFEIELLKVE
ncbi:MAG: FKBP-type peptidyl-prolyl cis-trans isomerase [Minisyncoccia bacterium]